MLNLRVLTLVGHQSMARVDVIVRLPNPHRSDIWRELLARILRQARIDRDKWERL